MTPNEPVSAAADQLTRDDRAGPGLGGLPHRGQVRAGGRAAEEDVVPERDHERRAAFQDRAEGQQRGRVPVPAGQVLGDADGRAAVVLQQPDVGGDDGVAGPGDHVHAVGAGGGALG